MGHARRPRHPCRGTASVSCEETYVRDIAARVTTDPCGRMDTLNGVLCHSGHQRYAESTLGHLARQHANSGDSCVSVQGSAYDRSARLPVRRTRAWVMRDPWVLLDPGSAGTRRHRDLDWGRGGVHRHPSVVEKSCRGFGTQLWSVPDASAQREDRALTRKLFACMMDS